MDGGEEAGGLTHSRALSRTFNSWGAYVDQKLTSIFLLLKRLNFKLGLINPWLHIENDGLSQGVLCERRDLNWCRT